MQTPFDGLGTQALPSNVPPERRHALGSDVDVCVCLVARRSAPKRSHGGRVAYLDRIQNLDDAGVSQRPQLSQRVLRERQQAPLCGAVEGKDAAV